MTIKEQLVADQKDAMKAKESAKLTTIRGVLAAIKTKEIDKKADLTDEEVQQVIRTAVKQLMDARKDFVSGQRSDLVEKTDAEIAALKVYLPAELSDEDLAKIVKAAVAESGAISKADMGKAMGAAVKAVAGRADGGRVKNVVMTLLQ